MIYKILDFFKKDYLIETFAYIDEKGYPVNEMSASIVWLGNHNVRAFSRAEAEKAYWDLDYSYLVKVGGKVIEVKKDKILIF